MVKSMKRVIAAAEPRGNVDAVRQLAEQASDLGGEAIALLGSLTPKHADAREYGEVMKALAGAHLPAFYIPGPEDAPFTDFLREAANFETVLPHIHGVHGTFAMAPGGHSVVSGMGLVR